MLQDVAGNRRAWMRSLADSSHLIVAFSGGADSVLAAHFASATGLPLTLWYLHHYNTPIEPARESVFTEMQGKFPQIHILTEKADIETLSGRLGYSWEHTASLVRRKRLLGLRRQMAGSAVVTGHNYSDYQETLALRRERKIPENSLPELSPLDEETGFLRPLYRLTRADVREQLTTLGLGWFEDPSNDDLKFTRNRIRKQAQHPGEHREMHTDKVTAMPAMLLKDRELSIPMEAWEKLSVTEQARTVFYAFRRLAVVRKFTRSHFTRAQRLPFALPPFFAHYESVDGSDLVIFRRGLGEKTGLPQAETGAYVRGDAVSRSLTIARRYGRKSIAKIFSEKKLSSRQRRQTLVYMDPHSPGLAARIVFPNQTELCAEII